MKLKEDILTGKSLIFSIEIRTNERIRLFLLSTKSCTEVVLRVCRASLKTVAGYYQYREHLNSSVIEANEQGQVLSYEEYYPYGRSAYRAAASGVDLSLKRYRFTGKERDEETGLDYFGVRYYASWLGRWTSGDPGGFVDGLNLYRYVRNNPVNGIDKRGYSTEDTDPPYKPQKMGEPILDERGKPILDANNQPILASGDGVGLAESSSFDPSNPWGDPQEKQKEELTPIYDGPKKEFPIGGPIELPKGFKPKSLSGNNSSSINNSTETEPNNVEAGLASDIADAALGHATDWAKNEDFSPTISSGSGNAPLNTYNSKIRLDYAREAAKLKPMYTPHGSSPSHIEGANKRAEMKRSTRTKMFGGGGNYLEKVDPSKPKYSPKLDPKTGKPPIVDGKPKANPRFYHTNKGVNLISRIGLVLGIIQFGLTINNLYQAFYGGYFMYQLKIETAKFVGAFIGSYIGAGVALFLGLTNPVFILLAISAFAVGGSYIGEQLAD